jgi:hypothetical protein
LTKLALFAARDRVVMTLGNMRENGVRSLAITCGAIHCHHCAVMHVSGFADDVVVPSFGPRMVCTVCTKLLRRFRLLLRCRPVLSPILSTRRACG